MSYILSSDRKYETLKPQPNMNRLFHLRMKHMSLLERLVDYGTLRQAAESLHVSEPAASQMLRDIEASFGVTLFERGRRGMTPTAISMLLINRARVILRELQAMDSDIADLSSQKRELVKLGALPRCMYALVPKTLARLYDQGFEPRIQITEASSSQLLEALEGGELDLALTRMVDDTTERISRSSLEITALLNEVTVIVCSVNHPLTKYDAVGLEDLLDYDWILPVSKSLTRQIMDTEFINNGLVPPTPKVEGRTATSLSLVQHSTFLTICPATVAKEWEERELLHILSVELKVPLPPISLICRISKKDNPSIVAIKDAVLSATYL
jgi:DNA-binding transcriptional LysR family regulator